jgi:hypothetical protein
MAIRTLRNLATAIPEDDVLQLTTDLINSSGIVDVSGTQFQVTANAALSVAVAAGRAYLEASGGNAYPIINTASATVNVNSNGNANPRITSIVLYVDLSASANSDASNVAKLMAIDGTPAASPSAPSGATIQSAVGASNPYAILANVTVPSGASNLSTQGTVTDVRVKVGFVFSNDGWVNVGDTFTYVSANSFKITGTDRTSVYTRGTRIKFTNNSVTFHGVVYSSSFSTDTTVTLFANNDFAIANSTITNPYYSYDVNPQGFPNRFAYTPTYAASSGTYSATDAAYFTVVGRMCFVDISSNGSLSSTPQEMTATLPVNAVGLQGFGVQVKDGGSGISGSAYVSDASNILHVSKYDGSNYITGASHTIYGNVAYFF